MRAEPYRNKRTVELLWHGLWTYVREHKVDVMIGCASLAGTDPDQHAMASASCITTPWRRPSGAAARMTGCMSA